MSGLAAVTVESIPYPMHRFACAAGDRSRRDIDLLRETKDARKRKVA
jgi:hypothetical protein